MKSLKPLIYRFKNLKYICIFKVLVHIILSIIWLQVIYILSSRLLLKIIKPVDTPFDNFKTPSDEIKYITVVITDISILSYRSFVTFVTSLLFCYFLIILLIFGEI